MKLLTTLSMLLLLSFSVSAAVAEIKCDSPNFVALNRFSLEQAVEVTQDANNENLWKVESFTLAPILTKSGYNAQSEEAELEVTGTLKRIESNYTREPYYSISLMSADKLVYIVLNLDYPSKLSSRLRTADGRLYKATCKLVGLN